MCFVVRGVPSWFHQPSMSTGPDSPSRRLTSAVLLRVLLRAAAGLLFSAAGCCCCCCCRRRAPAAAAAPRLLRRGYRRFDNDDSPPSPFLGATAPLLDLVRTIWTAQFFGYQMMPGSKKVSASRAPLDLSWRWRPFAERKFEIEILTYTPLCSIILHARTPPVNRDSILAGCLVSNTD